MIYRFLQPLLFHLAPETAHDVTLRLLKIAYRLGLIRQRTLSTSPIKVFGLTFPNPIGLAAGLDKNGDYVDALGALGFGFIEIGTVTPKPQTGNPKPRLFRLPQSAAIINRMGFNNKGVDYLVDRVKRRTYTGILGINIGKNKDTSADKAIDDYLYCLERVYAYADYVTINISSPNTAGLRDLQHGDACQSLLVSLKSAQRALQLQHHRYVPLLVKIAPDLSPEECAAMASIINHSGFDGVIATNTTIQRNMLPNEETTQETGGLSGKPLSALSTSVIRQLRGLLSVDIPIIGVGGISCLEDIHEKRAAGANLVQIYSALIYKGPELLNHLIDDYPK